MAFKGMNTDDGRTVAEAIAKAGEQIQEIYDNLTSIVTSVDWLGPDYDAYTADWQSFISSRVSPVVEAHNQKSQELNQQADQQDDTSNQN